MAALNNEQQIINSTPREMEARSPPQKRRRRRRNSKSSASSSGSPSPQKRKQRKEQQQAPAEKEMTETEKARFVAIDCEMVGVGFRGRRSSLARVVMVNYEGERVLDLYVRQTLEVTDYRTFVSGITEEDLESENAVDYEECRERVMDMLEGKLLVGHALKNDLSSLRIQHPWYDTRDTGKYEPFMKTRFDDGILWPRKLKELVKNKLSRDIQVPGSPHCPIEDATAAMDLYKHASRKWEKAVEYKMNRTKEIERKQLKKQ